MSQHNLTLLKALDVSSIIRHHWRTFYIYPNDQQRDWGGIALIYGTPVLLSYGLVLGGCRLSSGQEGALLNAAAIFAGLLLNLLALLFTASLKKEASDFQDKNKNKLRKETYSNISYAILLSLSIVLILMITSISRGGISVLIYDKFVINVYNIMVNIISFIVYSLVLHLGLSLLIILKRINVLLVREYRPQSNS